MSATPRQAALVDPACSPGPPLLLDRVADSVHTGSLPIRHAERQWTLVLDRARATGWPSQLPQRWAVSLAAGVPPRSPPGAHPTMPAFAGKTQAKLTVCNTVRLHPVRRPRGSTIPAIAPAPSCCGAPLNVGSYQGPLDNAVTPPLAQGVMTGRPRRTPAPADQQPTRRSRPGSTPAQSPFGGREGILTWPGGPAGAGPVRT